MADRSFAYRLLSLFTTPERAESIEGDLLEERHTYGRMWFAVNVVTTTFALWRQAVAFAFLRTAVLTAAAVALSCFLCGALTLVRAPLVGPSLVGTLLLIAAFAFLLGAGLVRVAPVIGASTAAATSLVLVLLFLYSQVDLRAEQLRDAEGSTIAAAAGALALSIRDLVAASLLYLLPLNLGSLLSHRRGARH